MSSASSSSLRNRARGALEHPVVPAHQLLERAQIAREYVAHERGVIRSCSRRHVRGISVAVPDPLFMPIG
jgi:hypothetical protein